VRGIRVLGRGLADTFEHLLPYSVATLAWWAVVVLPVGAFFLLGQVALPLALLAVLLLVPVPGATAALFYFADPRRAVDRPEVPEVIAVARRAVRRGWAVAAATALPAAILFWNLRYYSEATQSFAWLVPLWFLLLVASVALGLTAFSVLGLTDEGVRRSFTRAAYVTLSAPIQSVFLVVVFTLYVVFGFFTVIPLILFIPALIAATINRFVLRQLRIPVVDPLAPTEERLHEQQIKRQAKRR
jgi:hypothetical protein